MAQSQASAYNDFWRNSILCLKQSVLLAPNMPMRNPNVSIKCNTSEVWEKPELPKTKWLSTTNRNFRSKWTLLKEKDDFRLKPLQTFMPQQLLSNRRLTRTPTVRKVTSPTFLRGKKSSKSFLRSLKSIANKRVWFWRVTIWDQTFGWKRWRNLLEEISA